MSCGRVNGPYIVAKGLLLMLAKYKELGSLYSLIVRGQSGESSRISVSSTLRLTNTKKTQANANFLFVDSASTDILYHYK